MSQETNRPRSAQPNLQSHPCFQTNLYNDARAAGLAKAWKERSPHLNARPHSHFPDAPIAKKFDMRDYHLENVIWTQRVRSLARTSLKRLFLNTSES
jgi:hypothetical protein